MVISTDRLRGRLRPSSHSSTGPTSGIVGWRPNGPHEGCATSPDRDHTRELGAVHPAACRLSCPLARDPWVVGPVTPLTARVRQRANEPLFWRYALDDLVRR